jgi:hypothetical protein
MSYASQATLVMMAIPTITAWLTRLASTTTTKGLTHQQQHQLLVMLTMLTMTA